MNKLDEFRNMIDSVDDEVLLESGVELLRDMIAVFAMKEKIEELELGFTDGQKAIFYFFADELDKDEIAYAAERMSGRIRRINREKSLKAEKKNDTVDAE